MLRSPTWPRLIQNFNSQRCSLGRIPHMQFHQQSKYGTEAAVWRLKRWCVWPEERLRELWLLGLKARLKGDVLGVQKCQVGGLQKTEPDSSQWYPVKRQETMGTHWNTGDSTYTLISPLFYCEDSKTLKEVAQCIHPLRYSKLNWTVLKHLL